LYLPTTPPDVVALLDKPDLTAWLVWIIPVGADLKNNVVPTETKCSDNGKTSLKYRMTKPMCAHFTLVNIVHLMYIRGFPTAA